MFRGSGLWGFGFWVDIRFRRPGARGGGEHYQVPPYGPTHPTPAIAPDVGDSESKGNAINPK